MSASPPKVHDRQNSASVLHKKLWIYTNYDCHLSCTYCLAESTPSAARRGMDFDTVRQLVDEAVEIGFEEIFFTGGEPFILPSIFEMLAYSVERAKTTVLTTGMLLKRKRIHSLHQINSDKLTIQVSLDGGSAKSHDPYRGHGTWEATVDAIKRLTDHGFHVRLSTTETPANTDFLAEICDVHLALGIPEEDHLIRPLAKRGCSEDGIEISMKSINPEITVNREGIFWHPLSTDEDMRISNCIFPLKNAVECIEEQLELIAVGADPRINFT